MVCEKCGKEIEEGARFCEECKAVKPQNTYLILISILLSACNVILPFLSWVKVPVMSGIYSMLGMNTGATRFSLFKYIFSGSDYQSDSVQKVIWIIAVIAVIGIVLNLVYIIKAFKKTPKCTKYGTWGAVISIIISCIFIVEAGLTSAIVQVIKMTAVPYIFLISGIANVIVIKSIKKSFQ